MRKQFSFLFVSFLLFVVVQNPIRAQLIINEIHADPAANLPGDANGDGIRDASDDEFIEFVNTGVADLDISGWKIFDTNSTLLERHVFPANTILAPGAAIVVFGGGIPTGTFGGAIVQIASSGALGITNSSETIIIEDALNIEIINYSFTDEANDDQSITRDPDLTGGDAPMTKHSLATLANGRLFSPGTMVDGSPFFVEANGLVINEIHADPAADTPGDANGDGIRDASDDEFIEFVNTGNSNLDISGWKIFDTNSTLLERHVFPVGSVIPPGGALVVFGGGVPAGTFGGAIVQIASSGALGITNSSETLIIEDESSMQMLSYTFADEANDDQSITRFPDINGGINPMTKHSLAALSEGALYSPGTMVDGTPFAHPSEGLIINEIHADPAADLPGDANADGIRDAGDDEFIEFVNTGNADLDISGWKIFDTNSTLLERHVFPAGSIISPEGALVVFGGGTPSGTFGGAIIQTASSGALGITNSSETLIIEDDLGSEMISYSFTDEANDDQSITRSPDIYGSIAPMAKHSLVLDSGGALYSPGTKTNGEPFLVSTTTVVQFATTGYNATEGDGTIDLEVTIVGADALIDTNVDVVLISGNVADLDNYATTSLVFPAGSDASQLVTLTITDDQDIESDEVFQFELQNITGGNSAEFGENVLTELTLSDNDIATSSLVINEFMAWPAGAEGSANGPVVDSNGDGVASFDEDEFIEFVNNGTVDLDISGWQVYDQFSQVLLRHEFPNGTVINPGGALVLFGGGNPTGDFGGAQVQISSTLNLGLTNTNDAIIVRNQQGETIINLAYGQQTRGTSITLNPDITGAIGPHPDLGGVNISPGTKVDGSSFEIPIRTTVQFAGASGGIKESGGSFSLEVTIERPSESVATVVDVILATVGAEADLGFSTSTITFEAGDAESKTVEVNVIDDDLAEGDELFIFSLQNISGGTAAGPGSLTTFEFSLLDDDVPLIFNEIHADPAPGLAGDANNDGFRDDQGDEFIEVINQTNDDIDISLWEFRDQTSTRHIFPSGTILGSGKAVVVFGGGIPIGLFGGSEFQLASEATGLDLDDSGDTLTIVDGSGNLMAGTVYGALANDDQSITRFVDIDGGMVKHSTIPGLEEKLYSPGTRTNGAKFFNLVTGLKEDDQSMFRIYPNPVSHELSLVNFRQDRKFLFELFDVNGRKVLTKTFTTKTSRLDMSGMQNGIYYFQIRTDSAFVEKGKLLVVK